MATAGARYKLDDKAKATLRPALERFYICGIGAPPRLYHVAPPLPATWPSLGYSSTYLARRFWVPARTLANPIAR